MFIEHDDIRILKKFSLYKGYWEFLINFAHVETEAQKSQIQAHLKDQF